MRATLRRSCNACAKAKHRCDLRTPQCSRCTKRRFSCVYANEPLTSFQDTNDQSSEIAGSSNLVIRNDGEVSSGWTARDGRIMPRSSEGSVTLVNLANASFDPFNSYPPTRLPRIHVQRLIRHFLSNIAFQYYPLDLNIESNPFVVSWWPLALDDPALFHVSLQTASLDEELRAQKGFPISELLMVDSVSLVRQRIENSSLAFQDETLNSVVTLAAIEHGKGNVESSRMHIDGVKRMVGVRGGIAEIKRKSPLTARMVCWVSLLVTGSPQFQTQDDLGLGSGIAPTSQWQLASTVSSDSQSRILDDLDLDPAMRNILARLRNIFCQSGPSAITSTEVHDLTCFVTHRLLLLPPLSPGDPKRSATSECLRYALALYMLILHGTTYYSHHDLASSIITQLKTHLDALPQANVCGPLGIWIFSIGMVAAIITTDQQWFMDQAYMATIALGLQTWEDVLALLESILWMRTPQEALFRQKWEEILNAMANKIQ